MNYRNPLSFIRLKKTKEEKLLLQLEGAIKTASSIINDYKGKSFKLERITRICENIESLTKELKKK